MNGRRGRWDFLVCEDVGECGDVDAAVLPAADTMYRSSAVQTQGPYALVVRGVGADEGGGAVREEEDGGGGGGGSGEVEGRGGEAESGELRGERGGEW